MNREMIDIDIDDIVIKGRPREDTGDLGTLERSIRNLGLLFPVVIDKNNVLISGSRRLMACRNTGIKRIPALKLDVDFAGMTALAVQSDENLCRQPLSARELERLIQMKKCNINEKSPGRGLGILSWLKKLFRAILS